KPDVLRLPAYGCINVHGSLLPRWRGAAPIQRAILAGDEQTGICVIQMDQGLDTGSILATRSIPLENADTTASLSDKLSELGIAGLIEVCNKIHLGLTEPVVQSEEGTCYAHKISKEEANMDWDASSITVGRSIRAFYPDPVCYTFLGSMRVKLLKASMSHPDGIQSAPGKVLEVSKRGVDVACGTGSILLEQVQLPIGKGSVLTGADILNARSELIFAGVTFTRLAAEI
ncbi:MAG TPA: methionyl-tRNA formyltransferase, partial [Pseudomonadales bacterium]|nr:methionyl-tRNA formyltransferase [Pseudomonadales bacterium]